jgi:hypothetical protein
MKEKRPVKYSETMGNEKWNIVELLSAMSDAQGSNSSDIGHIRISYMLAGSRQHPASNVREK